MILELLAAGAVLALGRKVGRVLAARPVSSAAAVEVPPPAPATAPDEAGPPDDPTAVELRQTDRWLGMTGAGLGLRAVGALGVPVAATAGIPLIVLPLVPAARETWRDYTDRGVVGFNALLFATSVLVLASGQFVVMGVGLATFLGGRRALLMSRRRAHEALVSVFGEWSGSAVVLREGREVEVALEAIGEGELIVVRPGRPIPIDGRVVEGAVAVDQRMFTGESRLAERAVGDPVLAASLAVAGRAVVQAEKTGAATHARRLEGLINEAESYEQGLTARSVEIADRTFAPTVGMGAVIALARGPLAGVAAVWGNCIDMFCLTAPVAVLNTLRAAAGAGVLIKDGRSLDLLGRVDTVVFDKTGTLTLDRFVVAATHPAEDIDARGLLAWAAAAEKGHEHPIARAILAEAAGRGVDVDALRVERPSYEAGLGLRLLIDDREVVLGSRRLVESEGIALPAAVVAATAEAEGRGHTVVHLTLAGRYAGAIELRPELRPEARAVLGHLRARGLDVMILTGDEETPTRHLAESLGIETWFSRTLPEQKDARIAALVEAGRTVCFVGDGVNDALAMRRAHVSISMAGASAVAVDSAQIVMRDGSLTHLDAAFELGQRHDLGQRRLLGAALAPTAVNVAGVVLAGFSIPMVLGVYVAGLAASLGLVYQQGRFVPAASLAVEPDEAE
ncbi:MAG: HAD-IC family P-type ATPase [Myxococcales bacterium]|nr:HAD-IC family P-type ATPase [Myxococcales bacterium]